MSFHRSKNTIYYTFGNGSLESLREAIANRRKHTSNYVIYFLDHFFEWKQEILDMVPMEKNDLLLFVDSTHEPSTTLVNELRDQIKHDKTDLPCAIVGIGGGTVMDISKAVSNLLTNGGSAEDYQGWDLVKVPGVYKIGIPTLSGTGAEATKTCVMTNYKTGLKLGMNSEYTVFDEIIMDPNLTRTVPKNQYFYTGADSYIHSMESLAGRYRHPVGDAFSKQSIELCRKIFLNDDMMSDENRADLMVASYLGGLAIANSFVGLVHPFSAGLSIALGYHHCIANCIAMRGLFEFYPKECIEFFEMVDRQRVEIPTGICRGLSDEKYETLYYSTIIHEKPLKNALGENFKLILTKEKVREIFERM